MKDTDQATGPEFDKKPHTSFLLSYKKKIPYQHIDVNRFVDQQLYRYKDRSFDLPYCDQYS